MYSYMTDMIHAVETAIRDNYTDICCDVDTFIDTLNDELWDDDSVTGNGSGSYTMNRAAALANIMGDPEAFDYIREAADEFCIPSDEISKRFLSEDWEYFDVTIRCYLLSAAITAAVDNIIAC